MKLYLFLRSLIWTSILSVASMVAALIAAFTITEVAVPLALVSISLAVLSPKATR
jgi:hypothetical protein